jgi:N-acetylglucosamine-6-phosphate deacetylase
MIPRHANVLWPQLADDRLTATLIADGHHLPSDMLTTILRAKGIDRCILVSDAVSVAGLPPGRYQTAVGGNVELHENGRLNLAGTEFLAGAALPLKDGIMRVVDYVGISLAEALKMATLNPGRFVRGRGLLRPGASADLIRFTRGDNAGGLKIERVWVQGEEWSGG